MSRLIDLTGIRFERLTVKGKAPSQSGQTAWFCECDCGEKRTVLGVNLKSGRQKSCGCLDYERKIRHGFSKNGLKSSEYHSWQNMKKRCFYKEDNEYHNYGARGITVCDRWKNSFENFYFDMGDKPTPKHSVDRIDPNGNYNPSNCRWATSSEQIINQRVRSDNTSGVKGVSWERNSKKWFAYISPGNKQKRIGLGYFENIEDAIAARKEAEQKYYTH